MRKSLLRVQVAVFLALSLAGLWLFAFYELNRSRRDAIDAAAVQMEGSALAFAEHAQATIKRIDLMLLELGHTWVNRRKDFAAEIQRNRQNIADISVQVSIVDKDGWLIFSNLKAPSERVSLADREHIRIHRGATASRLFVSKPVKGRVSGKWSIQFTRPLLRAGKFDGVIVISISPELFSRFYQALPVGRRGVALMVRDGGDLMVREPDWEKYMGRIISDTPYLAQNAPLHGNFRRTAQLDGVERLYGYHRLPEYRLSLVTALPMDEILVPVQRQGQMITALSAGVSLVLILMALLILRSLTARDEAGAALSRSAAALREAQGIASVGSYSMDIASGQWQGSAELESIFGIDARYPRTIDNWLALVHPDHRTAVRSCLEGQRSGSAGDIDLEYLLLRHDNGTPRWMHQRSRLDAAAADQPAHMVGTVQDVTERVLAAEELNQYRKHLQELVAQRTEELTRANAELVETNRRLEEAQVMLLQSEKMASLGQLAAGVAHEINNPIGFVNSNLGSLESYLQGLAEMIGVYEQYQAGLTEHHGAIDGARRKLDIDFIREDFPQLLRESKEGLNRVKKIVQDLKDFSHVGSAQWELADLHAGLESTLNIVNNEIKYKAQVVREYGKLPQIECLPGEINQVFMNLLVNAAHAIKDKGEIRVRSGAVDDDVWIEIADNGSGIAPENLPHIFDPFFTTKPVGTGTGLGLSLSYAIIKRHHGRIEVRSTLGEGTTFRIRLPQRQPASIDEGAAA
ncbi:MAG TPA: ATP-binding protein [Rhodocyclaceae bacterium]